MWSYAGAEAQVAAIADDIAYDAHDIDDGLRAELFGLHQLAPVPLAGTILSEIGARYPGLDAGRTAHELVRRVITRMIEDVIAESARRLAALKPASADAVRLAPEAVIGFSAAMAAADAGIKEFLYASMYRHPRIARIMDDAGRVVRDLFGHYAARPDDMPAEWSHDVDMADAADRPRRIADYIAGMTDRYALVEHARFFDSTPELR